MENLKEMLKERNEMLKPFCVQIEVYDNQDGFFDVSVTEDDGLNEVLTTQEVPYDELGEAINDAHVHFIAQYEDGIVNQFLKLGARSQIDMLLRLFRAMHAFNGNGNDFIKEFQALIN